MPIKLTHYKIDFAGGPTHNSKKKAEYEYYICDYCGEHIKIEKQLEKRTGGVAIVPINAYKALNLALHNKCLKPCIKEINDFFKINI